MAEPQGYATVTKAVLFVCLGNICRSPLAEAAFRAEAEARGLDVEIDSAGTGDWHVGQAPDERTIATAARHGIDISGYQARQIRRQDFSHYDLILAADRENLRDLQQLCPPGAKAQIALLLDYVHGRHGQAVPDPYYGGPQEFEAVWSLVTVAAKALADALFVAA